MRRLLLLSALALLLVLLVVTTAAADNGPHQGDFTSTTDACAGCHRAHRGQTDKLLVEATQTDLCLSCHGANGTGADTNVQDGVYENRDSGGQYGTVNAGLRGGGFTSALMDPGMTGTPSSAAVTSKHNVDATGTIWGNGAIGGGVGKSVTLRCASCHNPHGISGGDAYRILRPKPKDSGAANDVVVPDDASKDYTITYAGNGYRDDSYLTGKSISNWCSQCHTRYLANNTSDSGDSIFTHRHATSDDYRKCMACHVAHGTSATMGTHSGAVELPDGTPGGGSGDSRLLSVNNRGVCYRCHPSP